MLSPYFTIYILKDQIESQKKKMTKL